MPVSCAFRRGAIAGAAAAVAARAALPHLILLKLNADVRKLNAGDYRPLLAGYADDAVLYFNDADHRWRGTHRGKPAIEAFLKEFVAAGVQGEILELFLAGPPWALTMLARFDDHSDAPDGTRLYANRTVLMVRTRWGKIVEHYDFYEDTERIGAFDRKLRDLGRMPVAT